MQKRIFYLTAVFGLFVCAVFFAGIVSAQTLPEDAPVLISQSDSTRALTLGETRGQRGLSKVFPPGNRTFITFFVTNLDLLPNEDKRAFRADLQDQSRKRYPLEIVSFEPTADRPWVYALTVRLNERIGNVGDALIRVNWRGVASNRVRISIGFEGGKIEDDAGSVPTPMPEKPLKKVSPAENLVGLPWTGDRVRFMEQATFAPRAETEFRIRRIGLSAWLAEQMEEKRDVNGAVRYSTFPYPNLPLQQTNPPSTCSGDCILNNYTMYPLQNWFFKEAIYGEDQQLRRRVSWALHQIWVVSGRETVQPSRMLPYIETLDRNAFGNYRDLMREMTLNPAMGNYLDMAISTAQNPNENYPREILQLFSIGLFMLNQDGTVQRDAENNPIPSYDQSIVNGFTKLFTGWTFCNQGCPSSDFGIVNYRDPLKVVNPANHDAGEKRVLSYPGAISMIPAGQTPQEDFEQALDNIFYHPNVAPFVSKLLIQQLVTSNPTPPYVERVANVFNDNGSGVRGDMKAVIRAILLDVEARGNLKTDPDYGKLREPVLYVTNIIRPMNPTANGGSGAACQGLSDGVLNPVTFVLDQDVFNPPTVFNYYPMDYVLQNTEIVAPEFGIFSTGTALKRPNFANRMYFDGGISLNRLQNITCGTKIDLTRAFSLIEQDNSGGLLVDTLNREMLHGSMSPQVRAQILEAVAAVAANNKLKRTQTALYLVATSPQFQVQR